MGLRDRQRSGATTAVDKEQRVTGVMANTDGTGIAVRAPPGGAMRMTACLVSPTSAPQDWPPLTVTLTRGLSDCGWAAGANQVTPTAAATRMTLVAARPGAHDTALVTLRTSPAVHSSRPSPVRRIRCPGGPARARLSHHVAVSSRTSAAPSRAATQIW